VSKKSRRRGQRSPLVALLVVALFAAAAAGWLLLPRQHRRPPAQPRVETYETPQAAETTAPAEPVEQPTEIPESPAPLATATGVVESPSPPPSLAPVPRGQASPPGGPKLAIIVDDCGQWIDTERGFVALGIPLTVSVLPDVPYTTTIAREAADAGKGVMLHLPMETVSGLNPGPGKVTTEMSDAQITAQVEADLAQVPLARGVNNHEGSKGSADARVMRDVVGVLAKQGDLFFIDSRTSAASVGEQTARQAGVPTAARDVFLDNQASVAYTEAQLREAAAIAERNGSAIAIGHPRPTTLAAVRAMIPELQAAGVRFVLARDLVSSDDR
jgi:uncharacterized protein